jgi:hypothetical protein
MLDGALPYSSKNLWLPDEIELPTNGLSKFDFEDLQTWSESYFENWHPAYPFLSAPTILQYIEQHVRPAALPSLYKH